MCAYREGQAIEGVFADDYLMRKECHKMQKRNIEHAINSIMLSETQESKYCIFSDPGRPGLIFIRIQIKYLTDDPKFTMTFSFRKEPSWDHYNSGMSEYFDQDVSNEDTMKLLSDLYFARVHGKTMEQIEGGLQFNPSPIVKSDPPKEDDKDDKGDAPSD